MIVLNMYWKLWNWEMRRLLNIFLVIICFFGCKTDSAPLGYSSPISASIDGEWEWTHSKNAWTGEITAPEDLGYDIIYVFGNDSTLKTFKNNSLHSERKYYVIYSDSNDTKSEGTLFILNGSSPYFIIENNELMLSEAHIDGPVSYYKRKK